MKKHEQLLNMLEAAGASHTSGEEISRMLNVSRTAVWKHVNKLRELGYVIEASPRLGYTLAAKPDKLSTDALSEAIRTDTFGRWLHLFETTVSTQEEAMRLAKQGAPEGSLVLAEEQTGGRGRQGRKFFSPSGKGIWMSVILRPQQPLQYMPQLTLLAGVAVCRAVRRVTDVEAVIKWPNDLLVDGRKICGILLESAVEDQRVRYCIAGIGIDVNLDADDYPEELKHVATSLKEAAGTPIDRTALIAAVMEELEDLYTLYRQEGFKPIGVSWEALSATVGRQVSVRDNGQAVEGTAEGLDASGALLVRRTDGSLVTVFSGDIQINS
ncbi:biotin--[acetyl-CoA-carboxylase] ligase [Paenibacillus sp. P96]|uniref:Bifunctional ligase/repressor BirA n=1 Tax=Paenibacillus zeirhizosphaerae TaxID=2987519 RepID=A0ABT9FPG1_9BACL|nr:biotin--[acetyl-CoA-carboxylase] ligase [Paenibacillus sp. P96]MDP4096618.1 biotin--[acetyl-CoA-carboxylase] ligase [Paenibacillus sp. P96]